MSGLSYESQVWSGALATNALTDVQDVLVEFLKAVDPDPNRKRTIDTRKLAELRQDLYSLTRRLQGPDSVANTPVSPELIQKLRDIFNLTEDIASQQDLTYQAIVSAFTIMDHSIGDSGAAEKVTETIRTTPSQFDDDDWLTAKDVEKHFDVSRPTLQGWERDGVQGLGELEVNSETHVNKYKFSSLKHYLKRAGKL